ncbi:MAG: hypothetical protein GWP61_22920 [Chloroflexi bacterium]|jgi:hypothetical protein|nr:hypothetical protein [Chloroflexota bacterium]
MGMQNFAPEFQTPEQYIIDITYHIWEERGVGLIHQWYAADSPVRTPHVVTNSVDAVVRHTLDTMHEFPDRELLAEDVIIGDKTKGFYSSHRVRSTATHLGDGAFGPVTKRSITMLAIADCLCRDNQVVEEWLIRDQAAIALQLGIEPEKYGQALGANNPDAYAIGNEAMRRRWVNPNGLAIIGDQTIANSIIQTYDVMWNEKNLQVMMEGYDRAVRFEGFSGQLCYGRSHTGNIFRGIMASIPDGRFEPYHIIVHQQTENAVRVALRWSYCGTHGGYGRFGEPGGSPLAILAISHFELRDGLIKNEWVLMDETSVYAQMAAHHLT